MSMLDLICWGCIEFDKDDHGKITKAVSMEHTGHGRFKCPVCGATEDLSQDTYTLKISRVYEDGYLFTDFIEIDSKIDPDWAYPEDDFGYVLDDLPWGKYLCEVYCSWTYSGEDWDCTTILFSAREIKQISRPLGWQFR